MLLEDIMITHNIRLGPTELKLILTLEKEDKRVFNTKDAYRILDSSKDSVNTALYRLRKKNRIEEIERGKYLLIPAKAGYEGKWAEMPFLIASHLVEPYYIGFASALNYWGMTEQMPNKTFIVTTKRKKRLEYDPLEFEFVTITKKRFFGITNEVIDKKNINISNKEKTIIDCLLHPKYCGGVDEIVKGIWEERDELDFDILLDYANQTGIGVVTMRLLYLLDILGINTNLKKMSKISKPKGFMWLDPAWPKQVIEYSKEYKLIINRTKDSLTRWKKH